MRYLAIDRILSKEPLIQRGRALGTQLKSVLEAKHQLSTTAIERIDQLVDEIQDDRVIRLVSVLTPIEDVTPITFDLVFDYKDLSRTEAVELSVEHILFYYKYYLTQFPLGHHCEIFVRCHSGIPKLFDLLPVDAYDTVKVGLCHQQEWDGIRDEISASRRQHEEWQKNNNKPI